LIDVKHFFLRSLSYFVSLLCAFYWTYAGYKDDLSLISVHVPSSTAVTAICRWVTAKTERYQWRWGSRMKDCGLTGGVHAAKSFITMKSLSLQLRPPAIENQLSRPRATTVTS